MLWFEHGCIIRYLHVVVVCICTFYATLSVLQCYMFEYFRSKTVSAVLLLVLVLAFAACVTSFGSSHEHHNISFADHMHHAHTLVQGIPIVLLFAFLSFGIALVFLAQHPRLHVPSVLRGVLYNDGVDRRLIAVVTRGVRGPPVFT